MQKRACFRSYLTMERVFIRGFALDFYRNSQVKLLEKQDFSNLVSYKNSTNHTGE